MKLSEVFPEPEVARLLSTGEIRERIHPDGGTRMWTLESVTPSSAVAACMKGVIFRDGEILARPMRKFWPVESEGFPETKLKNLALIGFKKAVHTEWIDGHSGRLYYNLYGTPMLAGNESFSSQPWIWASQRYRSHFNTSSWPAEYTPNFVVQHPDHVKTLGCDEPRILLVGLVHMKTGEEVCWQDLKDWANYNGFPVPNEIKASPWDFPQLPLRNDRGVVMRWDFPDETLRVGWFTDEFLKKAAIADFSPLDIAEMLEQDIDVEPLKKQGSAEFARWVETWRMRLHQEFFRLENRVVELLALAENVLPPVSESEFEGLMEFFGKCCEQDTWTLPILARWLRDQDYMPILWEMTKNITKGEGRFQK